MRLLTRSAFLVRLSLRFSNHDLFFNLQFSSPACVIFVCVIVSFVFIS
jgi:hypothetical protein